VVLITLFAPDIISSVAYKRQLGGWQQVVPMVSTHNIYIYIV